jgi:phospholipid/cholesterol/gamma-HCH transport system substrate-binding protein
MHYTHRLSQKRIQQVVGWFVFVPVLILGAVLFVVAKNENLFQEKYDLTTVFDEGYDLKVASRVLLLGVPIGRIGKIEFTDQNNARFTLRILKKYQDKIRENSVAKIGKAGGFFGEPYIEITVGNRNKPIVADGGHIEGVDPLNITDIMEEIKPILESAKRTMGQGEQIAQDVRDTISTTHSAISEVQKAATRLPEIMGNIRDTTATVRETARAISGEVPAVAASARKSMDRVAEAVEDVKGTTAKLPAVVENARLATEDLKDIIHQDIPPIVRSAQGTMDDVSEILAGAKKTFPISIFATKGRARAEEDSGSGAVPGLRSLRPDDLNKE